MLKRLTMNDNALLADNFLASSADLVGILAQFAEPNNRRSRIRTQIQLAQEFPQLHSPASRPTLTEPVRQVTQVVSAENHGVRARSPRRCACGACERCLDNARWDRIFNEKFADPTYYAGLRVRQNSTLAGMR